MIAQMEDDSIFLLPALPVEWSEGSMKGLRLPGGYLMDMSWKNGTPQKVTIQIPQGKAVPKIQWKGKAWEGAAFRFASASSRSSSRLARSLSSFLACLHIFASCTFR